MLAIIHALVGGLIGEEFNSILLIAIASFALHFLFDMFPHWDANWDKKRFETTGEAVLTKFAKAWFIIDMILAIVMIASLYNVFDNKKLVLGAFMGILPDLMSLGYKTKLKKSKHFVGFLKFHSRIQKHTDWKKSMITQAIIISLLTILFIIIYFM
jgi:hypothetical protein